MFAKVFINDDGFESVAVNFGGRVMRPSTYLVCYLYCDDKIVKL